MRQLQEGEMSDRAAGLMYRKTKTLICKGKSENKLQRKTEKMNIQKHHHTPELIK